MRNLLVLLPPEFALLVMVAAGLALVVGARGLASGLAAAALAMVLLPVLLAPVFDLMPGWMLIALLVGFGLALVRSLFNLLIGVRSTDHMVGTLAADVVRWTLLAPFRFVGWIVRRVLSRR